MLLPHIFTHVYLIPFPTFPLGISISPQSLSCSPPSQVRIWNPLPSFLSAKKIIVYLICMLLWNFLSNLIFLQVYLLINVNSSTVISVSFVPLTFQISFMSGAGFSQKLNEILKYFPYNGFSKLNKTFWEWKERKRIIWEILNSSFPSHHIVIKLFPLLYISHM